MLTLIYRGIVALVLIVVGWNLFARRMRTKSSP